MSYKTKDLISQSDLTLLSFSPLAYYNKKNLNPLEEVSKSYFDLGSLVDALLSEPQEVIDKQFAIDSNINKPSDKLLDLCNQIVKEVYEYTNLLGISNPKLLEDPLIILDAREKTGYNKNLKEDTLINKVLEYKDYMLFKLENYNKVIIDSNTYNKAHEIVNSLLTNDKISKILDNCKQKQLEIYWNYNEEDCKSKLDFVKVDEVNKEINIYDLKTTSDYVYSFPKSIIKFRYDLQGAFYVSALYEYYSNNPELLKDDLIKYTFNFYFIVESTSYPGTPLLYKLSEKDLSCGVSGGILKSNKIKLKGFVELIDDLKWHKENNLWEYPREVYENNMEIETNIYE